MFWQPESPGRTLAPTPSDGRMTPMRPMLFEDVLSQKPEKKKVTKSPKQVKVKEIVPPPPYLNLERT